MLEEVSREEKQGYNTDMYKQQQQQQQQQQPKQNTQQKKEQEDIIDTYGDDFEEEIDEELPEDNNLLDSNDYVGRMGNPAGQSIGGITVSQSLGVDPSVDSLALEDYDHVEPVERMM